MNPMLLWCVFMSNSASVYMLNQCSRPCSRYLIMYNIWPFFLMCFVQSSYAILWSSVASYMTAQPPDFSAGEELLLCFCCPTLDWVGLDDRWSWVLPLCDRWSCVLPLCVGRWLWDLLVVLVCVVEAFSYVCFGLLPWLCTVEALPEALVVLTSPLS